MENSGMECIFRKINGDGMKIVIDDKIPFIKKAFEQIGGIEAIYLPGSAIIHDEIKDADALIIRTRTKCDKELLAGTNIKFIASATIGYDHIDTGFCEENNICWTNSPGCNSSSVAQYITSALLNLAIKNDFSLSDKTLGIIGVGNVGSKVAAAAEALGLKVLLNDPPRAESEAGFTRIAEIKKKSDIITMHVPLNMEGKYTTFHMADHKFFSELERRPYFINSSRGEVAETGSMLGALKIGFISGAVLDVWENEPEISRELMRLADIVTPHIAGYSADGKANGTAMSVNAVAEFFDIKELKGWEPENIPEPENTKINLSAEDKNEDETILSAVAQSYDIMVDDKRLRNAPEAFEKQRGVYPLRREFPVFSVKPDRSVSGNALKKLEKLGFVILPER
jgi:erythronate-4-phosphate dehydrogenase